MSSTLTSHRPTRLGELPLEALPATVSVPRYPRTAAEAVIVHFGVGAFHRSHQAVYLDDLMNLGAGPVWGICGVGLLESDAAVLNLLKEQDCLYSVFSCRDDGQADVRVVSSLRECLQSPVDREQILDRLCDPGTRIASMTITEGGYNVNESTGQFDLEDVAIRQELTHPSAPMSVFGYVVEALRRRRAAGVPPFTVLSCDNVEGNGNLLRRCILSYAGQVDDELAAWIGSEVRFPNSMVDRITPVATAADSRRVSELLGCLDSAPVVAESFRQWVVEDHFSAGRPELDRVGVQFVEDVRPFELMKLRLLNGAHQALGYVSALLDFQTVHEAANEPLVDQFVQRYLRDEAATTVPEVPGISPADYIDSVRRRLRSDFPPDTVARLIEYGSDRLPKFVVPVIKERLTAGLPIDFAAHILAAWAVTLRGTSDSGRQLAVRDHRAAALQDLATEPAGPGALLGRRDLFGDLGDHQPVLAAFMVAATAMTEQGVRPTLERLLTTRP